MASKNIPPNGWPQLKDLEAVQPTLNRLDKIEAWKRTVKEETFTGDDFIIPNALKLPARSLKTTIEAIQDLHGYDHPWVGGAGKNKVETPSATAFTARGITLITASNGETTLNGTSTAGSIDGDTFELPAGTYTISVGTTLPSGIWISLDGVGGAMISPTGKSISFTTTEAISTFTHIYVNAGVVFNNFKLNWMLEEGSTATSFAPYSNICPISGRTEARVDTENEDSSESAYAVIQLGQTVYGADINWDTGVMTVNDISITFDGSIDEEWSRYNQGSASAYAMQIDNTTGNSDTNVRPKTNGANGLNSTDTYGNYDCFISTSHGANWIAGRRGISTVEDWKTWLASNPIQVCYKLATPITLQLTPTQLQLLKGYNRVTLADGYGTIELKALTGANWS